MVFIFILNLINKLLCLWYVNVYLHKITIRSSNFLDFNSFIYLQINFTFQLNVKSKINLSIVTNLISSIIFLRKTKKIPFLE